MSFAGQSWWLVGGSDGLGLALARALSREGARVILSGRDPERLAAALASLPGPGEGHGVPMDVAQSASVRAAAREVGPIDGLVYLAALYWPMLAEDWDADRVTAMCDVNFTGCARVLGEVLPPMIARGRGHVVITGSLSGFRGLPGAIGYGASKAGVMALAESLRADLHGTCVKVQLANPGFIRTRLTAQNDFAMPALMEPDAAAGAMLRLMQGRRFATSFPRPFAWLFRAAQFLPEWVYYPLVSRVRGG